MPDNPPSQPVQTVNQGAQDAVTLIEDATKKGEQIAEAAIIAQAPFMGSPILKQIWETAFDYFVKFFMKPFASLGGRVVIDVEEYIALKNVATAQVALDAAKKSGDENEIYRASKQVDDSVAPVIQYVGATHA